MTREARTRFVGEHVALLGHRFARKLPEGAPAHLVAATRSLVARLPQVPAPDREGPEEDPLCEGCPASRGC